MVGSVARLLARATNGWLVERMGEWLVAEHLVFGVATQNWMWLVGVAFALPAVLAALTRNGRPAG
jgi:ABC-type thiamine transport system substrate-binding protein